MYRTRVWRLIFFDSPCRDAAATRESITARNFRIYYNFCEKNIDTA